MRIALFLMVVASMAFAVWYFFLNRADPAIQPDPPASEDFEAVFGEYGSPFARLHQIPEDIFNAEDPGELGINVPIGSVSMGWADQVKLWDHNQVLRVCFFGGHPQVNAQIARVASEWNHPNLPLRLEFFRFGSLSRCGDGGYYHIRISFNQHGYFSAMGRDSEIYWPQHRPSMNLQNFDNPSVLNQPNFFRNMVLHEFGHALGLGHEHQSPGANCDFNWDLVYQRTSGPPNFWSTRTTDHNMRPYGYFGHSEAGTVRTSLDRRSVMMYDFPPNFYLNGASSHCYTPNRNAQISQLDRVAINEIYRRFAPRAHRQGILHSVIREGIANGDDASVRLAAAYLLEPEELESIRTAQYREETLGFGPGNDGAPSSLDLIEAARSRILQEALSDQ